MKVLLRRFIFAILACYVLLCMAFYFFQHLFFFHPVALSRDYQFQFKQPFTEAWLQPANGAFIHYIKFKVPGRAPRGLVLYFHGNSTNVERYARYADRFTKNNYECWMMDYPGFGKSTGKLTHAVIMAAALELYKVAMQQYKPAAVIIYGKSLGTGPASFLASESPCKTLVLETPYASLHSVASRYAPFLPVKSLIKVDFTPVLYIKKITAPVLIFHGLQDEVIPYAEALLLLENLKPGDKFISIPECNHNNVCEKPLYQTTIDSLLQH